MSVPITSIEDSTALFKKEFSYILIISLVIIFFFSSIISKIFTKPLFSIKNAAKQIASGNLNINIKYNGNDELYELSSSINKMSKSLKALDEFRKDLIANITHDLKTPLGLIRGYGEMINDFYGDDKENRTKYINLILNETNRMSLMIDDILSLSKLQSGSMKLNLESFNLDNLINEVMNSFDIITKNKEIQLIKHDMNLNVLADKELIRRVIFNVISNSINSIKSKGEIVISSKIHDDNNVLIKLSDNGCGISRKDLPHIFDKYKKGVRAGTGLGLAIVKEILTLHKSKFYIESKEGKGTDFYFTLRST